MTGDPELKYYSCALAALADATRAGFASPGAHWTTVQLAPYTGGVELAPFREMQRLTTARLANASSATLVDDSDPLSPIGSVHSRNKELVGARIAPGILNALYGTALPTTGPIYAGATFAAAADGSVLYANVSFDPATLNGGLAWVPPHVNAWQNSSRCPTELPGIKAEDCDWFNILGSDGVARNATLVEVVEGGTQLALTAPVTPAVPGLRAVGTRFGWNAFPVVNAYDAAGLPVQPWNASDAAA